MKFRLLVLPVAMVAAIGIPCIFQVSSGVHFKGPALDFGMPPPRATMYAREWEPQSDNAIRRPGTMYGIGGYGDDWEAEEHEGKRKENADRRAMRRSRELEMAGRLTQAAAIYRSLGDAGNFTASRLELFATPGIANAGGLPQFLDATHPLGKAKLPSEAAAGPLLKPWIAYANAHSASDYLSVAHRYPASSRAAAALIMAGRQCSQAQKPPTADLQLADGAFRQLLTRYPKSRFAWDARGGLARIDYLRGRLDVAVKRYEEQFRSAENDAEKTNALASIAFCARAAGNRVAQAYSYLRLYDANRESDPFPYENMLVGTMHRFNGADSRGFWKRLRNDPPMLATYCEWRATAESPDAGLTRLAAPSLKLAAGTPYEGRIAGALARVSLEHGDVKTAARYARIAGNSAGPDEKALGTYILATVDRRANRLTSARDGYRSIVQNYPKSYLAGGARESLALVSERLGDLATAMDQYIALNYTYDVAYLSDMRMTPAELASYVRSHPKRQDLRYTLGMRYLRKHEWSAAEAALRPLTWKQRYDLTYGKDSSWSGDDGKPQDPMVTLRDLRKLDGAVKSARGTAARATALTALGDYYYAHKCLLLYSNPAWSGQRDYSVSFSWNEKAADKRDEAALRMHYDEHECYSQALACYREVVKRYPKSKSAGHAAYWAAVSAEHLSNMAPFWRWRERGDDLQGDAVRLMAVAMKSGDAAIRKKATKYHGVFQKERASTRAAFAQEKAPPRRWMED